MRRFLFSAGIRERIRKISESRLKLEMRQHLPLCLSEMAVISGLTLLTVFGTGDIKALVGVFALAAFRLLPALRGILGGWTQVQNAVYSLRIIEEGLGDKGMEAVSPSWGQEAFSFQKEIRIEHLTYAYPESKEVLKDFCCTIRKGEYVGICGESGVGKSTLFNLLLGFITPDKGAIRIDGRPLADVRGRNGIARWICATGSVCAGWDLGGKHCFGMPVYR